MRLFTGLTIERAIIIALGIVCVFAMRQCQDKSEDARIANIRADKATREVVTLTTKNGEQFARITVLEGDVDALNDQIIDMGEEMNELIDENASLRRVNHALSVKAHVHDTVVVSSIDTVYVDSAGNKLEARKFDYSNKWMTIAGVSFPHKAELTYSYKIEFNTVTYRERRGFLGLGKGAYVTDLKFNDPKVVTTQMQSIMITPKKPVLSNPFLWGTIGVFIGAWIRGQ